MLVGAVSVGDYDLVSYSVSCGQTANLFSLASDLAFSLPTLSLSFNISTRRSYLSPASLIAFALDDSLPPLPVFLPFPFFALPPRARP